MTQAFDPRRLRIGVEVDDQLRVYEDLLMSVTIEKFANPLQNTCKVKIVNLKREIRNYLLTETSPFNKNRKPKRIQIEAGRVGTGLAMVFRGDITTSVPSQPPDIAMMLDAKTGQYDKGNVVAVAHGAQTLLSTVAIGVAKTLGLALVFQAADKKISNFSFTGAALKMVEKLGDAGSVNAYVDDKNLIVKDYAVPLRNVSHQLSKETGLIGQPEATEQGVKVRYLFEPTSQLGGRIELVSQSNPALTGNYTIYKLAYELSNRELPWYCVAECQREGFAPKKSS